MGLFNSINTAASGLTAQRLRLDVISNNIANVDSSRTAEGGVFRRKRVILKPRVNKPYWKNPFVPPAVDNGVGKGVRVVEIEDDMGKDLRRVYDPSHPDSLKSGPNKGYVFMPNVNVVEEMVDMISASRSYEANIALVDGSKDMFMKALEIGR